MEFTQPSDHMLSTAKPYWASQQQDAAFTAPAAEVQRDKGSCERTLRWMSPLIAVMLGAAIALTVWKHKDSLASTSREVRERVRNPLDFVLWIAGSDKTMADMVKESQRQAAVQFEDIQPAYFGDDLKSFDPQSLLGQPFHTNGQRGRR